jgi:predicted SnoaL-like aldol condensation-catalyzing enzyme
LLFLIVAAFLTMAAQSQTPVTPNPDHEQLLKSSSSLLAKNKRLVYDFWREVFEAGQWTLAGKYLAADLVQHNPNIQNGRQAFIDYYQPVMKTRPVLDRVQAPLVHILAEDDKVVLTIARELVDPGDPTKKSSSTWFEIFRISNGLIVEHWDSSLRLSPRAR